MICLSQVLDGRKVMKTGDGQPKPVSGRGGDPESQVRQIISVY